MGAVYAGAAAASGFLNFASSEWENGLREQVSDRWQETFAAAGLSDGDIDLLSPSFEL